MAAIITQDFRKFNTQNFMDKLLGSNPDKQYYVGIGKPNPWPTPQFMPTPLSGPSALKDVKDNLVAAKAIRTGSENDVSFGRMIPNIKYIQGRSYKFYNSHDDSCWYPDIDTNGDVTAWPCYVVKDGAVWLVAANRPNNEFDEFNSTTNTVSTPTDSAWVDTNGIYVDLNSTGYIFAKFCNLATSSRFLDTDEFVEIDGCTKINTNESPIIEPYWSNGLYAVRIADSQLNEISAYPEDAEAFEFVFESDSLTVFHAFELDETNTKATVAYRGADGSSRAVNTIDFSEVNVKSAVALTRYTSELHPFEYIDLEYSYLPDYSKFSTSKDLVDFLPSWYIGFNTQISSASLEIPADISYRQISILSFNTADSGTVVNPSLGSIGANDPDPFVADALQIIELSSVPDAIESNLSPGDLIYGDNNSRAIYVGMLNDNPNKIKIIQNKETGFTPLTGVVSYGTLRSLEDLKTDGNTVTVSSAAPVRGEMLAQDEVDVMFVENTPPLIRNNIQIEDLKIIIQF